MDSNPLISLTLNGVLYLSLGFKQHYYFQVLACRVGECSEMQLVLYDGLAYIGALYYPSVRVEEEDKKVLEKDIVKIYPLNAVRNQPVIIESLQIVSSPLEKLLGREIISLQELMRRKTTAINFPPTIRKIEDTQPRKLLKTNTQEGKLHPQQKIIFDAQPQFIQQEAQKHSICSSKQQQTEKTLAFSKQNNIFHPIQLPQTQKATSILEEPISLEIQSNEDDFVEEILTQKRNNNNKQSDYIYQISSQDEPISFSVCKKDKLSIPDCLTVEAQPLHIRDLYERMHRFEIQCRINHITSFTSQKGTKCVRLVVIDSLGDEVICLLFQNHNKDSGNSIKLNRGKTYIFRNGQVQSADNGVTVILPWNGIFQSNKNIPSFLPQRMMRAGQIQRKSSSYMDRLGPSDSSKTGSKSEEHNFAGIFMGFKQTPKIIKNGFRVTGTLCDPDQRVCVIFNMVADELLSFPTEGTVVSLHNFTIIEQDRIIRLQSSKKGYIIDETYNYHEYFLDLVIAAKSGQWKRMDLRNLSQVTYIHRNIGQLRRLMSRTIDFQQIYSEFDCFITNIVEKIKYNSCVVCRKVMKNDNGPFSYCLCCKKPQPSITRFIFQIQVADSTGSIDIGYNRDQLEQLLGMTLQQYSQCDDQQRKHYLQLTRYKCIVIRLKSERVTGGEKHLGTLISKLVPQRSLQQIKDLAIEEKTNFSRAF